MDGLIRLTGSTLADLPQGIRQPRYDRARLTPGIVHIGLGNFHRAHQAWYLHRLMDQGLCHDWAIIGAGVRAYDARMRERLLEQDFLTTLIELDPHSSTAEVTGPMIDYLPVQDGHDPLIRCMADPAIRIVSLTVTEGGYYRAGGAFDASHEDILADVAQPAAPRTAFGAIVAALRLRRAAGHGPFTVQSCDNLQNNGDIVRDTLVSLARLSDPDLATWIEAGCSFPNSMVDCIVPATGTKEIALTRSLGIVDQVPVTHEPFRHWVTQDDFCAGRPDWGRVGVVMTPDVHRFETMKLRILNGGHQILANAGDLLGIETIAEAMAHPLISALLRKVETEEILPQVAPVPGFTPQEYLELIERRFANPRIIDTTRRVAFDGASRHPGFLMPSLRERLARRAPVEGLALVQALWARYCLGTREDGSTIEANDPAWDALLERAGATRQDPSAWLDQPDIYGDTSTNEAFHAAFTLHLTRIHETSVAGAIEAYLTAGA